MPNSELTIAQITEACQDLLCNYPGIVLKYTPYNNTTHKAVKPVTAVQKCRFRYKKSNRCNVLIIKNATFPKCLGVLLHNDCCPERKCSIKIHNNVIELLKETDTKSTFKLIKAYTIC